MTPTGYYDTSIDRSKQYYDLWLLIIIKTHLSSGYCHAAWSMVIAVYPFLGIGTPVMAVPLLDRRYVGIETSSEYIIEATDNIGELGRILNSAHIGLSYDFNFYHFVLYDLINIS